MNAREITYTKKYARNIELMLTDILIIVVSYCRKIEIMNPGGKIEHPTQK